VPHAAAVELDALYREVAAAAPTDPAVATLLELAEFYCVKPSPVAICRDRSRNDHVLAIRERALRSDDPILADTRLVNARRLFERKRDATGEAMLRRVLAEAEPGAEARVHAAIDLIASLRGRGDREGARGVEALLIADLRQAAGRRAWMWTELATTAAELAKADGRAGDAARIYAAAVSGIGLPCGPDCDNRQYLVGLLARQAEVDAAAATTLAQASARVKAELDTEHQRQVAEVRRILARRP
jgi:hypothetical protein